jgi:putative phage-type endonuclease
MISEEQKKISDACIGGSTIAAVLGLSNFRTKLQVWGELTGMLPKEDISGKMQVRLGNKMEAVVAEVFTEDTGKKLHRVNETFTHDNYPYLVGHIDRRVVGERAIVEIKAVSAYARDQWKDGKAPQEYVLQLMWYLGLTKTNMGYLVALVGNTDLAIVPVIFDKEIYETMVKKAVDFWENFVIPKVMPMQITSDDGSTLYQLFPIADPNKDIMLTDEANRLIEQIESASTELKMLEADVETYKNLLKAMLKDGESGQTDKYRVTWKTQHSNRIDTERFKKEQEELYKAYLKTTSTRVLRYSQKDKK